jgi:glycosyltransferase involved in cell wall biosynthesis
MKIWLDATPVLHGERAVRRNTRNLITSLIARNKINYGLFYFDRKGNTPGRFDLTLNNKTEEKVCRYPMRFLLPFWKNFGEPNLDRFIGHIDLLYATDLYFPPVRKAPVISTIRGIAYIAQAELLDPNHCQKLTKAFYYARKRSDYFLAVSQTTRNDLLKYTTIPANRIFVVTHGIDPVFKKTPKSSAIKFVKQRFNLNRPFLLFVGAIAVHKNVHGLLDAFLKVALNEKDIDLVLVGPEESAAADIRKRIEKQNLRHRVHFLGSIDQKSSTLTELYNAAEMLVFPSFYEGWCAPPLEAMACGTPVVCSDVPAVAEVTGTAAVQVDPNDSEAITDAICKVLYDTKLRDKMIQKGNAHVANHTWERSAERLETIFAQVLQAT